MVDFEDLRGFIAHLDSQEKVFHFNEKADKDSEIIPLLRLQLRGLRDLQRRVMLFDQVTNASGGSYDMRVVAGVYGISEDVLLRGIGCSSRQEALDSWHRALEHPITPVVLSDGPVHEEIHVGDELSEIGLDALPVPVEEPGFSQMIRTGTPVITVDPDTGVRNVGTYNGFIRDRNRMVVAVAPTRPTMTRHWQNARRRGEPLPVAIVIGGTPNVMLASSAGVPYGTDELAVAGGITDAPVPLVRCRTVPLEVPANAEIVIEGLLSTEVIEPRLAFGEYPGYMNMERNNYPVMTVTAITHRRQAIFTPVTVGFSPSDDTAIEAFCSSAMLYHKLRYECGFLVEDVVFPQMGAGVTWCVIKMSPGSRGHSQGNVWQVLNTAGGLFPNAKYIVAVDSDVDVNSDPELLLWALAYRVVPETDFSLQKGRFIGLDPSFGPTGSSRGKMAVQGPASRAQYSRCLIDATMAGPYPPVALPRQDFMEHALSLWREHPGLPELDLRPPWHGYDLGYWSEEDQGLADLIVAGDYRAVGDFTAARQEPAQDVASPDAAM